VPGGVRVRDGCGDAPSVCVDRRAPPSGRPCACDLDCEAGELCLVGLRDTLHCEIPCLGDEDCPADGLVCGPANLCVPLGP